MSAKDYLPHLAGISIIFHCLEAELRHCAIAARIVAAYVDCARKFCSCIRASSICFARRKLKEKRRVSMAFELPALPYDYDALAPSCRAKRLNIITTSIIRPMLPTVTSFSKVPAWKARASKKSSRKASAESGPLQQCRPALQPYPFLEMDEEGWRRQETAGQAGKGL